MSDFSLLDIANYRLEIIRNQDRRLIDISKDVIDILSEVSTASRVSIIYKDPVNHWYKFLDAKGIESSILEKSSINMENSILDIVLKSKETVFCRNILEDDRFGIQKRLRYDGVSFISSPIIIEDRVIGFLSLSSFEREINEWDQKLVENMVEELGYLINKKLNFEIRNSLISYDKVFQKDYIEAIKESSIDGSISWNNNFFKNEYFEMLNIKNKKGVLKIFLISVNNSLFNDNNLLDWFYITVNSWFDYAESQQDLITQIGFILKHVHKDTTKDISFLSLEINLVDRKIQYLNSLYEEAILYNPNNISIKKLEDTGQSIFSEKILNMSTPTLLFDKGSVLFIPSKSYINSFDNKSQVIDQASTVLKLFHGDTAEDISKKVTSKLIIEENKSNLLMKF